MTEEIDAFWVWWAANEARLADAVGSPMPPELIAALSAEAHRIHPDLTWEFGPGAGKPHAFALSGAGDPVLRLVAERWVVRAPASSSFEFYATKQAMTAQRFAEAVLELGATSLDFAGLTFSVDEIDHRQTLEVVVCHPALRDLDEEPARMIATIALDNLLGEDAVERWISGMEIASEPAELTPDAFRSYCQGLGERWVPGTWVVGEGTEEDERVLYVLDAGVKRWDHPFLDTWVVVQMEYSDRGLPASDRLEALNEAEDRLVETLVDAAVHIGHRTGAGTRSIYLYVDGDFELDAVLRAWAADLPFAVAVRVEPDPGWHQRP